MQCIKILFCKYIVVKNALYNVGPKNILENPTFLIHELPDVSPVQYIGGKGLTWPVILTQLSASLAFGAPLMHQGSLLKITPGWAAGVPHEHTQVHLLTLPNVWGLFRLGIEGFLVTPLRHICVMLWAWAPKSALGSYKRLRSYLSHLEVVLQTTKLLGANLLLIFPY